MNSCCSQFTWYNLHEVLRTSCTEIWVRSTEKQIFLNFFTGGGVGFTFFSFDSRLRRQVIWHFSMGTTPHMVDFVLPCPVPPSSFIPPVTEQWANTLWSHGSHSTFISKFQFLSLKLCSQSYLAGRNIFPKMRLAMIWTEEHKTTSVFKSFRSVWIVFVPFGFDWIF